MILWGHTDKSGDVKAVTLKNENGMEVTLISFAAAIQSIRIPDSQGNVRDVVLGFDTVGQYENDTEAFGAVVGRNANRIGGARFTLDGKEYLLEANNGKNNLHSGSNGLHHRNWKLEEEKENSCTFSAVSQDMEQGFPGCVTVKITYELTAQNELVLNYQAETDQTTIVNLTNHAYFNLDGHDSGSVLDHRIAIFADAFTPFHDAGSIPTGELRSVEGTPMDLRKSRRIGEDIDSSYEQLVFGCGYDHNYVLRRGEGPVPAAEARGAESGICLEVWTDRPGLQFYTGNFIPDQAGKNGAFYTRRTGFCLETQAFPDAVNHPDFPSVVLHPGEVYRTRTIFKFSSGILR